MELAKIVLIQTVIMFIYIIVGFGLYKKKIISDSGAKTIGSILVYVVIPSVIVKAFFIERTPETTKSLLYSFGLGALALVVAILIALAVFRNKQRVFNFGASFSNAAFMGTPLVTASFGEESVIFITGMIALLNILQYTYGQYIINGDRKTISFLNIIKSPVVISLVLGLIVYAINVDMPSIIKTPITGFAALNAPLAMMLIGVYLARVKLLQLFTRLGIYLVSFLRLVIIPIITMLIFKMFKIDVTILSAILIAVAAPVGSNIIVFAQKNDVSLDDAVLTVCQSTIFSIITLPLIIMLGNYIFSL